MSIEVIQSSLFSTIQDRGRAGYSRWGVPSSGMMDDHSGRLANWLAGNKAFDPLIEICISGGVYRFHEDTIVGITGAIAACELNDQKIRMNQSIRVNMGDTLKIGPVTKGKYLYLAIRGLMPPDKVMGSFSTFLPASIGGIQGRILKEKDRIGLRSIVGPVDRKVPRELIPHFGSRRELRVIRGPEWRWLTMKQQSEILSANFISESRSDRMGIRLNNSELDKIELMEMKSSPVIPGIIQYSGSGNLILLHRDAQTIGGYPRLLKVIDADLWRAAQCTANVKVSFKLISMSEAMDHSRYLNSIYPEGEIE
ncbi:biotin-dependent carboxyltransferase family protein [Balneola sp. MJW-20]|uniref:5-oxoprolinase subunit C family protein n=1 Tax=Gracilimonas aurantiaca TaxID=3234185 RepID=UPI003467AFE6